MKIININFVLSNKFQSNFTIIKINIFIYTLVLFELIRDFNNILKKFA